jgi:hypothetical protein
MRLKLLIKEEVGWATFRAISAQNPSVHPASNVVQELGTSEKEII